MEELKLATKIALANTFVMYYKAHAYHWNVEGMLFPVYHDFFGDLYEDVYGAIDPTAEELRVLGEYAPQSLEKLYAFATVTEDEEVVTDISEMLQNIQVANEEVLSSLNKVFDLATSSKEQGLADFVAGRIDTHKKHGWMIRSSLKSLGK